METAVIEQVEPPAQFPINSSNASMLAKKSWEIRRARDNAQEIKNAEADAILKMPEQSSLKSIIMKQIELIDERIENCPPAKLAFELPRLADAKAKLWKLLFPQPKASRSRRDYSPAEPIE